MRKGIVNPVRELCSLTTIDGGIKPPSIRNYLYHRQESAAFSNGVKVILSVAVLFVLLIFGCGAVYTNIKTPMPTINLQANALNQTKIGKSTCTTYLWVVTIGDCSIAAAMKNGELTRIHHVDTEVKSILMGIFAKHTIVVYGE